MNKVKLVKSIDGTIAPRLNTRRIDGKYYIKGKQTVQVGGSWHRINNGKIALDMDTNTWLRIGEQDLGKSKLIIQEIDDKYVYGFKHIKDPDFLFDLYIGIPGSANHIGSVEKEEDVYKLGFRASKSDFYFYKKPEGLNKNKFLLYLKRNGLPSYKFALQYNFKPGSYQYQKSILSRNAKRSKEMTLKSSRIKSLDYFLKGYSFGLEFETNSGAVPITQLIKNGLIPLRDGSINGHEYVTPPLTGARGVNNVYKVCRSLDEVTTVNEGCSLHVHVGGFNLTKTETVALYYLCVRLQSEIHEMIAPFKRDFKFLQKKDKDHTQLLQAFDLNSNKIMESKDKINQKELVKYLNRIWVFLTGGYGSDHPDYGFGSFYHPLSNSQKWNQPMRYFWVNMMPVLFNPGSNRTVEFRCHQATNKHFLVIPWLILCVSIIKYTKANSKYILNNKNKISISDIIEGIKSNFSDKPNKDHKEGLARISKDMKRYYKANIEIHSQKHALNKKSYNDYEKSVPELESLILGKKSELSFYEQK